jgi:hypothetical protein
MSLRDVQSAVVIFVNGATDYSALQLGRDLDCQYKMAFDAQATIASPVRI